MGHSSGALEPSEIETLLCDCTISRVILGPDSRPVNLGSETRSYPRWMRRVSLPAIGIAGGPDVKSRRDGAKPIM